MSQFFNPLNWFGRRPDPPAPAQPVQPATGAAPAAPPAGEPPAGQEGAIPWLPVTSSNLHAVAYFPRKRRLLILFNHGGAYRYDGVPAGTFNSLMSAPSKGVYHAYYIKWAYPFDGPYAPDDPALNP